MTISEIQAKTLITKRKSIDSWFLSSYGLNLYRGCTHNCAYCDGRAEGYYVEGIFGKDISVKTNSAELLDKELNPTKRRKPLKRGFIVIGGGVCDSYQPVETKFELSRRALEIVKKYHFPVHLLTKSILVERDLDLISEINKQNAAIVSFSFSSCNKQYSEIFEPSAATPDKKLASIKRIKDKGISCGMFLMPVIPFITDTSEILEESIHCAKEAGVDYIIFSGMTLKSGRQKNHFYAILQQYFPTLINKYDTIYPSENQWGQAISDYYTEIQNRFFLLAEKYKIPVRIPVNRFRHCIDENDYYLLILSHLDYLLKAKGEKSYFGYAAHNISMRKVNLYTAPEEGLLKIKGVNKLVIQVINELKQTGECTLYDKLLFWN